MVCRDAPSFEDFVRERLSPRSEAGKMITSLSKDTSLSNAVAMTIESLSASKSRELRHIINSFELYCDWVEDWEPKGWEIGTSGSWVILLAPEGRDWAELCARRAHPPDNVVAAGAGVSSVKYDDFDSTGTRVEITYRIVG
jgi:hypothetical protein